MLTDNLQYALAPQLTGLKSLWDAGRLAVQLNVGPLIQPTTLAQYQSTNRVANPLPPKLFSHNDQQSVWQANGTEGSTVGWGGRLGDIAMSSNATNSLLTCISASGNAVFVAGRDALQYQVSPGGAVRISGAGHAAARCAQCHHHACRARMCSRTNTPSSRDGRWTWRAWSTRALAGVNPTTSFGTGNPLANQLKIVARLIGARAALGDAPPGVLRVARRLRQSQPAHAGPSRT